MSKPVLIVAALFLLSACSRPESERRARLSRSVGSIVRLDPAFDALVPASAHIEKLAGEFQFTGGLLWRPEGVLWFSDVAGNVVWQWSPGGKITEILRPGGADRSDAPPGSFIGPNGLAAAADGAVILCQQGNRRIVHIDKNRRIMILVDRWHGERLNSPGDLVYKHDGALYFTDPPYG
ncbi:MAG: SMP-30/gluconolactonase/LRE family protein, partial [Pseudomonadota bacterium]